MLISGLYSLLSSFLWDNNFFFFSFYSNLPGFCFRFFHWGTPCGVMAKVLDCGLEESEFELQSRYNVHFETNTIGTSMKPLYPKLWVKFYYWCSTRVALPLNNPRKFIYRQTKEPNQTSSFGVSRIMNHSGW